MLLTIDRPHEALTELNALREIEPREGSVYVLLAKVHRRLNQPGLAALCAGTGFRGRVAIAELLVLDDALRSAFTQGASLVELRAMVRARGVRSLREDGWRCVAAGETTIDEVVRMVSEDDGA